MGEGEVLWDTGFARSQGGQATPVGDQDARGVARALRGELLHEQYGGEYDGDAARRRGGGYRQRRHRRGPPAPRRRAARVLVVPLVLPLVTPLVLALVLALTVAIAPVPPLP